MVAHQRHSEPTGAGRAPPSSCRRDSEHAHLDLHVVHALVLGDLQLEALKAHAVILVDHAIKVFAQDVLDLAGNARHKA